jgi:hypothetical protein
MFTILAMFSFFNGAGTASGAPTHTTGFWLLRARRRLIGDD